MKIRTDFLGTLLCHHRGEVLWLKAGDVAPTGATVPPEVVEDKPTKRSAGARNTR